MTINWQRGAHPLNADVGAEADVGEYGGLVNDRREGNSRAIRESKSVLDSPRKQRNGLNVGTGVLSTEPLQTNQRPRLGLGENFDY